jgi:hypothetical protein
MGQSKPIQKRGSCTSVLGQTSTPVASRAMQTPTSALPSTTFFLLRNLEKQKVHLVCESEEAPTAVTDK